MRRSRERFEEMPRGGRVVIAGADKKSVAAHAEMS
jgi:hypothetical protein